MPASSPAPEGSPIDLKLARLRDRLRELGSVLVCYSGGVDSAFVLAVAHQELGPSAVGMTAVSPSLAPAEREEATAIARLIGADHRLVESSEIDDPRYVATVEAIGRELRIHVVAGVVAQTWRGGSRQARVSRLLDAAQVRVVPMDDLAARAVGVLCAASKSSDVVDAHVALDARRHGHVVLTSDTRDLIAIDPSMSVIEV